MLFFDKYGNLTPYDIIESSWEDFMSTFVQGFEDNQKRLLLFERYLKYLDEIKSTFQVPFSQWVNGSFVTKKDRPGDIDMVTFLPYDLIVKKAIFVEKLRKSSKQVYGIDGFLHQLRIGTIGITRAPSVKRNDGNPCSARQERDYPKAS